MASRQAIQRDSRSHFVIGWVSLRGTQFDTGKGQIFDIVTVTVNFRNDVFNVERGERRIILMQMTVFASVLGHAGEPEP